MRVLVAVMVCVAALAMACGVRFKPKIGTEYFTSLNVEGEHRVGAPMSIALAYEHNYPVDVQIECELRKGKEVVKSLGATTAAAIPNGGAEATPVAGEFRADFTVDAPGDYKAECFTPADDDNYIIKIFTVT